MCRVAPVTEKEAIELDIHRLPLELPSREVVEHPIGAGRRTDIADIMDTDVPLIAIALVGVRVSTRCVVLFEDAHALTEIGQESRRGKAAHPGSNDDHVIVRRQAIRTITVTNS